MCTTTIRLWEILSLKETFSKKGHQKLTSGFMHWIYFMGRHICAYVETMPTEPRMEQKHPAGSQALMEICESFFFYFDIKSKSRGSRDSLPGFESQASHLTARWPSASSFMFPLPQLLISKAERKRGAADWLLGNSYLKAVPIVWLS